MHSRAVGGVRGGTRTYSETRTHSRALKGWRWRQGTDLVGLNTLLTAAAAGQQHGAKPIHTTATAGHARRLWEGVDTALLGSGLGLTVWGLGFRVQGRLWNA